jgi:hypothetical protein
MLHAAGMVHRDVKPANCLFVGGQLKLGDFGLLTAAHPLVSRMGTQRYMPPDGRMDMRADVYAAGLVIYEMLSGLPVEEFPRLGGQSNRIADSPILTSLLRLVLRACEAESEKRPPDAGAMLAELAMPAGPKSRQPQQSLLVAIGAIAVVAVVGTGMWIYRETAGANSGQATENVGAASADKTATTGAPRHADVDAVTGPLSATSGNPRLVEVSFVTDPFESQIYLDDELLCKPGGKPYTTPCTVNGLPARTCRVSFRVNDGPRWEAKGGPYDFSRVRQIVSKRP